MEVTFSSLQSVVPHLKAGTLRAIALTSAKRSELMPELPTLAELGLKDFDVNPWFGVLAPAATPPALVARVNRDINDVINAPDVKARFTGIGAVPLAMSPEAFDAQIKSDLARWGNVVRYVGIKID